MRERAMVMGEVSKACAARTIPELSNPRMTVPGLSTLTLADRLVARLHGPNNRVGDGSLSPLLARCMIPKSTSRPRNTSTLT